jgi:hypothetical protein
MPPKAWVRLSDVSVEIEDSAMDSWLERCAPLWLEELVGRELRKQMLERRIRAMTKTDEHWAMMAHMGLDSGGTGGAGVGVADGPGQNMAMAMADTESGGGGGGGVSDPAAGAERARRKIREMRWREDVRNAEIYRSRFLWDGPDGGGTGPHLPYSEVQKRQWAWRGRGRDGGGKNSKDGGGISGDPWSAGRPKFSNQRSALLQVTIAETKVNVDMDMMVSCF